VGVSRAEKQSLLNNVRHLHIDPQVSRLTCLWLEACLSDSGDTPLLSAVPPAPHIAASAAASGPLSVQDGLSDPLDLLEHIHRGLLQTLAHFVAGVDAMRLSGRPDALFLANLTSLWHFVCAVSAFHRLSEDLFVFPTARSISGESVSACNKCEDDHRAEAQTLTALGRLLSDLSACSRRGANATDLLQQLHEKAARALESTRIHTALEEAELLPELRRHLSTDEKFTLVRHSLQTLPLRLLERVVPWLARQVGPAGLAVLVQAKRQWAKAAVDTLLVQLLGKWAQRAFAGSVGNDNADMHSAFPATTCMPQVVILAKAWQSNMEGAFFRSATLLEASKLPQSPSRTSSAPSPEEDQAGRAGKRPRSPSPTAATRAPPVATAANPIDHIFQFHKALRQELRNIEREARLLQDMVARVSTAASTLCSTHSEDAPVAPSSSTLPGNAPVATPSSIRLADAVGSDHVGVTVRLLEGRLRFLEGIYKAHSESEDEVVFPALEARQALQNVSTFYTLDHQEEAKLFAELRCIMDEVRFVPISMPGLAYYLTSFGS
jgi:zinc finger protein-like protein